MAISWTLELTPLATGIPETKTLDAWGITNASRNLVSLAPDTLELIPVAEDSLLASTWAYKDTVKLFRDGVKWFHGHITSTRKLGTMAHQSESITVSGPWWWLEQIIFQQAWGQLSDSSPYSIVSRSRSRVLAGMNDGGSLITTGAQIDAILAFAVSAGAPITIGATLAGQQVWTTDFTDATCASVIKALLKWHPAVISTVDYTTATPTLHIDFPGVADDLHIDDLSELQYEDGSDKKVEGVYFKYERTHDLDGTQITKIENDFYPPGTPETGGPNIIVSTIPLEGARSQTQKQQVVVDTIPPDGSSSFDAPDAILEAWWQEHVPWLADLDPGNLTFDQHAIEFARRGDPAEPVDPDAVADSTDPADYPRELISGTITDWMPCRAERLRCTVWVAYRGSNAEVLGKLTDKVTINSKDYPAAKLEVEITGTDATNRIYSKLTSLSPPEPTPTGLAQAYYTACQDVTWEGSLTITQEDVSSVAPNRKIRVMQGTGPAVELIGASPVQEVSEDIKSGTVRLRFGPAEHLSPQDFFEKAKMSRNLPKSKFSIKERTSGDSTAGGGQVVGGQHTPKTNSVQAPPKTDHIQDGFKVTLLPDSTVKINDGLLVADGDDEKTVTDASFSNYDPPSDTSYVWAVANTDMDGTITGEVTVTMGPTPPGDLKKHRQAGTDSAEDVGDSGKYAWKVITFTKTAGVLSWVRHLTGIQYYSDRSEKNWSSGDANPVFTEDHISSTIATESFLSGVILESSGDCYQLKQTHSGFKHQNAVLEADDATIFTVREIDNSEPPVESITQDVGGKIQKCINPGAGGSDRIMLFDSAGDKTYPILHDYVTYKTDTDVSSTGWVLDETTLISNDATKVPTQRSVKSYVDDAVSGLYDHKGGYNAATNTPDLDSLPSGIEKADTYIVTSPGTFFTESVAIGTQLIANQDDPITLSHWTVVAANTEAATTDTLGLVELATNGEAIANVVVQGNDSRLSNARTPTTHSHPVSSLSDASVDGAALITKTNAGIRTQLNVADGATANSSDNYLLARANHTGTQLLSTISDKGALASLNTIATAQIDNAAVTLAKITNISTDRLIGRNTAGTGVPEQLTPATVRGMLTVAYDATHNDTDESLRDRTTHTGSQAIGTITGLEAALAAKASSPHSHVSTEITDSTSIGRDLLTAPTADAAKTVLVLDAGDIPETTSRKWMDATQEANVDLIQTGGAGGLYLDDTGTYTAVALAEVTGLQAALDTKSSSGHSHILADITDASPDGRALIAAADYPTMVDLLGIDEGNVIVSISSPPPSPDIANDGKFWIGAGAGDIHENVGGTWGLIGNLATDADLNTHTATPHATSTQLTKIDGIEDNATRDQTPAEIYNAFNALVPQVSSGEIIAGTSTSIKQYSPLQIVDFITQHGFTVSAIDTLAKINAIVTGPDLIDTSDPRLADDRNPTPHEHPISSITNLQTTLNGKAASNHQHPISSVTDLQTTLNGKLPTAGGTMSGDIDLGGSDLTNVQILDFIDGAYLASSTSEIEIGIGTNNATLKSDNTVILSQPIPWKNALGINAGDVSETASRKWLDTTRRDKIDVIETGGPATTWLDKSGNYSAPPIISSSDVEAAYDSQVPVISSPEISDGSGTEVRRYRPVDVYNFVTTHAPGGLTGSDIDSLAKINGFVIGPDLIDTSDPRLADDRTPIAHGHSIAEITALQSALDGKSSENHTHIITETTGLQTALDGKAATAHGHAIGDVTGLQGALDTKASSAHTHIISDTTGLQAALDGKASDGHEHVYTEITGLVSQLATKASSSHSHSISDVSTLQTTLNGKAALSHTHQISHVSGLQSALDDKAVDGHGHLIADVTNLQSTLNGKAPTSHTHTIADISDIPSPPGSGVATLQSSNGTLFWV